MATAGTALAFLIGAPLAFVTTRALSRVAHRPGAGPRARRACAAAGRTQRADGAARHPRNRLGADLRARRWASVPPPACWRWPSPTAACSARCTPRCSSRPTRARARAARSGQRPAARRCATGCCPTARRSSTSYTVYRWECAVRASVVMGFVGAGGLGQLMDQSMKMLNGGEASSILLVFLALVLLADALSNALRRLLAMSAVRALPAAPPPCLRCWAVLGGVLAAVVASFVYLAIDYRRAVPRASRWGSWARFIAEFFPPDLSGRLRRQDRVGRAADAGRVGARHAAGRAGGAAARAAGRRAAGVPGRGRRSRFVLNLLRSVPELVWAALMVLAARHRPFAGRAGLGAAHHRRAGPAVRREPGERAARARTGAARTAARARRGLRLRQPAAGAAAVGGLHALPLGDEHPHGGRAGLRRRRRPGPAALLPPVDLPAAAGHDGADRHVRAACCSSTSPAAGCGAHWGLRYA